MADGQSEGSENPQQTAFLVMPEEMANIISNAVASALAGLNISDCRPIRIPLSEISAQIPNFSAGQDDHIENWLKRVDIVQRNHSLDDATMKVIATNKLLKRAKQWYDSQAEFAELEWTELKNKLQLTFRSSIDRLTLLDEMQQRKWKPPEKIEEYFYDKVRMLNQLNTPCDDTILYIIRGIDNTILRVQLKSQTFTSTEDLLLAMKSCADELPSASTARAKKSDREKSDRKPSDPHTQIRCYNCSEHGHYASSCEKPKRKKGSCFLCGDSKHIKKDCPKNNKKAESSKIQVTQSVVKHVSTVKVRLEDEEFNALVDSGSSANIICEEAVLKMKLNIEPDRQIYTGLGMSNIRSLGRVRVNMHLNDDIYNLCFSVVPDPVISQDVILGEPFFKLAIVTFSPNGMNITKLVEDVPSEVHEILQIENIQSGPSYSVNPEVGPTEHNLLSDMLTEYQNEIQEPEPSDDVTMTIRIMEDKPIVHRPRRLSMNEQRRVREMIEDLQRKEIVRPSKSEYCSPIVLTRKKNGEIRLCVDYRALNAVTVKEKYPLPLIDDILDKLNNKRYFTLLDLKNGFHHIRMSNESVKYTSFVTPFGQYEYVRMPFGLTNAPGVFQRYINLLLSEFVNNDEVLVYLDDIMIATETLQQNIDILKRILVVFSEKGLQLRLDKCFFFMNEVDYLGYRINKKGIGPSRQKTKAVAKFPEPTNVHDVRSFLGLTGYFRRFIKDYARIAKPLSDLLRKEVSFRFEETERRAFENLKTCLASEPVLSVFDPKLKTELHTDASSKGYGAILLQQDKNNKFHPIYYYSSKTSEVESKYHSFELEALAIVKALNKFRVYLLGNDFKIVTDCNALKQTLNKREICPRINRWCLMLNEFRYTLEHRKSESMCHVDALSRYPVAVIEVDLVKTLKLAQTRDPETQEIINKINSGDKRTCSEYDVLNGLLFRKLDKNKFVIPRGMRRSVVTEYHDNNSHVGYHKTISAIREYYWAKGLNRFVKQHIKNCLTCIQYNDKVKKDGFMYMPDTGNIPFRILHVDHLGPLNRTNAGYKHVFVVVDAFSKFVFLRPVKQTDSLSVIKSLKEIFSYFGNPKLIISDRGTSFTSADFENFCIKRRIKHVKIAVSTPHANGQVERYVRTVKSALAKCAQSEDWSTTLESIQFGINNTIQRSINSTPSKLLLGYDQDHLCDQDIREVIRDLNECEPVNFDELRQHAADRIKSTQKYNKQKFDSKRCPAFKYTVGDFVCIKRPQVLSRGGTVFAPKFQGPYVVTKLLENDRYVVEDIPGCQHTQRFYTCVCASENMKLWPSMQDGVEEGELPPIVEDD